ncbi:MAG: Na+/H+ antiporter subunit E [Verrucomicrobiota bacterium]
MKLIILIARYTLDFIRANLVLAKQVLSPRMELEPETIEIDTKVESDLEILALSNMITFTPGSLTLDLVPGEKITVHFLLDGQETADDIRDRLEKQLLEITRKSS